MIVMVNIFLVLTVSNNISSSVSLSVVILAAGGSSRFGRLKQLFKFKRKSLLKHIVEKALKLQCKEILVVHGSKAAQCQREIFSCDTINIINERWKTGISSSLILAIDSISVDSQAILILLCDQPLISYFQLKRLVKLWKQYPKKIIASKYGNTVGVPVILPREYFKEVKKLKGDMGAKKIISDFSKNRILMRIPEAAFDIDNKKDFSDLLARK